MNDPILILCRDLLLSSKITGAARSLGTAYLLVRDPDKLAGRAGVKLLVDLNEPGALEAAQAWRGQSGRPVIGFVSHVDAATIARAKEGGIDEVVTRGRFFENVAAWLSVE